MHVFVCMFVYMGACVRAKCMSGGYIDMSSLRVQAFYLRLFPREPSDLLRTVCSRDKNCTWSVQGPSKSRMRVQAADIKLTDCSYYLALSEGGDSSTPCLAFRVKWLRSKALTSESVGVWLKPRPPALVAKG